MLNHAQMMQVLFIGIPDFLLTDLAIDQWCSLCNDGNDTLVACDECDALNCGSCILALAMIPGEELEVLTYRCVSCSTKVKGSNKKSRIFQVQNSTPPIGLTRS